MKPILIGSVLASMSLVLFVGLLRPGVFVVQPLTALPDGVTFLYYGRGAEIPFFASPDGLCLTRQGSVTLLCRVLTLASNTPLLDRVLIRFPYSPTAYLWSTGGYTFAQ